MNRIDAMELNPLIAADGAEMTFEAIIGAFGTMSAALEKAIATRGNNPGAADWHDCLCQAIDMAMPLLAVCRGALSYESGRLFAFLGAATRTGEEREQAAELNPLICPSSRFQTFENITASITDIVYLLEDVRVQDKETSQPGTAISVSLRLIASCSAALWFECSSLPDTNTTEPVPALPAKE
ncbi:hypothetical protein [Aquitalea magnusonii]|uniref:hypothetical protein n=1 Tax=Aquitalea magnusonii TaxID=332411 RepID=UPI000B5C577B|nr:hypothetical protein [Aquitalea magnusonii]